VSTGASDASTMAKLTFGHTEAWAIWLWASFWLLWSLVVLYAGIKTVSKARLRDQLIVSTDDPPGAARG
jgi:polyferredoxin